MVNLLDKGDQQSTSSGTFVALRWLHAGLRLSITILLRHAVGSYAAFASAGCQESYVRPFSRGVQTFSFENIGSFHFGGLVTCQ